MQFGEALLHALNMTLVMTWEIFWALVLGFALSGIIQAVVSKGEMSRLLPDSSPRSILKATALGAASSSCSYAATAIARSIFRKGGDFIAAMAFQFASTNLVLELGIVMVVLLGWRFALAEFVGGPIMILILVLILRRVMTHERVEDARRHAEQGVAGRMEGHAAMDMSVPGATIRERLFSSEGFTAVSHYYVMDWASVWLDIVIGLVAAGLIGALVPESFWSAFFLADHPLAAKIVGPLVGPLVAVIAFVCSVGNVPLAAVLWAGGISFGGVIAFIFADLIILPILNIYRKYYGTRVAIILGLVFYAAMAGAAYVIEILFSLAGLLPQDRSIDVMQHGITWNYTSVLDLIALAVSAVLIWRFMRTGGPEMLAAMESPAGHDHACHAHGHAHHHHHG
ncbi:MAG: uncharacterized protein QOF41_2956 [Methylobacteriaceae bacterium]|jgi:uncharacterized membrane protein YraQ (UPF0718 family)|nr:uncharacterized protein [Methylobacteriaceae bacterium]